MCADFDDDDVDLAVADDAGVHSKITPSAPPVTISPVSAMYLMAWIPFKCPTSSCRGVVPPSSKAYERSVDPYVAQMVVVVGNDKADANDEGIPL